MVVQDHIDILSQSGETVLRGETVFEYSDHCRVFEFLGEIGHCMDTISEHCLNNSRKYLKEEQVILCADTGAEEVRVRVLPVQRSVRPKRRLQSFDPNTTDPCVVICEAKDITCPEAAAFIEALFARLSAFSPGEVSAIRESLPVLGMQARNASGFETLALIWRDHFLEENVALLEAMIQAGLPPEHIFALDKGDSTRSRARVREYFRSRGMKVGLLDNGFNDQQCKVSADAIAGDLINFAKDMQSKGLTVAMIDDGATLWRVFGDQQNLLDFGVELTLPGLTRLAALDVIRIPVLNLAGTRLKKVIGYREVAQSCLFRIQELLNFEKLSGRDVVVLGYGTAGSFLADGLAALGSHVHIVETDLITLISAIERGYKGYETLGQCLADCEPLLVLGASGATSVSEEDLNFIPDGAYISGVATRDLSVLVAPTDRSVSVIKGFGTTYQFADGRKIHRLGDGRSVNLFESEAIPNKGYDLFKSAIFVCTKHMISAHANCPPGVRLDQAEEIISKSGILRDYFEMYLEK